MDLQTDMTFLDASLLNVNWNDAATSTSLLPAGSSIEDDTKDDTMEMGREKIRNCRSCRFRRVKCERIPGQKSCVKCLQKDIHCEPMPKKQKKIGINNRTGRRIEAAKALFGPSQSGSATGTSDAPSSTSRALMPSSFTTQQDSLQSGVAARLNHFQLQGDVAFGLINQYLENFTSRMSVVEGTALRNNFELAGRQINSLDDQSQVLCHVLIAISSRYTTNPIFVGENAPSIEQLRETDWVSTDLSIFGSKREAAAQVLMEQAIAMVDAKGSMRKPTPESLAALVLLDGLLQDQDIDARIVRPYAAACVAHAKALADDDAPSEYRERVVHRALGWSVFVRDSMSSAVTGRSPSYTEDDILVLRGGQPTPPPLNSVLRRHRDDPLESFWDLSASFIHLLTSTARAMSAKLTGVSARRAPRMDEDFVHQVLDNLMVAESASLEAKARLRLVSPHILATSRLHLDAGSVARGFAVSHTVLIFQVYQTIEQRLAEKDGHLQIIGSNQGIGSEAKEENEYWARLAVLLEDVGSMCIRSCRRVGQMIKETLLLGGPIALNTWNDGRGTRLLFIRMHMWLPLLLNQPTIEQDGDVSDWTFATKIDELTWILHGLYSIGWSFPGMGRPASWLKEELGKIERQRDEFYATSGTLDMPALSIPAPSTIPIDVLSDFSDFGQTAGLGTLESGLDTFASGLENFASLEPVTSEFNFADAQPVIPDLEFQSLMDSLGVTLAPRAPVL